MTNESTERLRQQLEGAPTELGAGWKVSRKGNFYRHYPRDELLRREPCLITIYKEGDLFKYYIKETVLGIERQKFSEDSYYTALEARDAALEEFQI